MLSRHGHESDGDGIVRVQVLRAVLDDCSRATALDAGGDVENPGFDTARAETAPVCLSQAQNERFFAGVMRLEGLAEAAEDFFVLVLVFLGEDDECGRSEAVLQTREAAALLPFFCFRSAFCAVAAIGFDLSL